MLVVSVADLRACYMHMSHVHVHVHVHAMHMCMSCSEFEGSQSVKSRFERPHFYFAVYCLLLLRARGDGELALAGIPKFSPWES